MIKFPSSIQEYSPERLISFSGVLGSYTTNPTRYFQRAFEVSALQRALKTLGGGFFGVMVAEVLYSSTENVLLHF